MQLENSLRRTIKRANPDLSTTAAPSGFDGVWRNELGSTMDLTVTGNSVSGTYKSAVSGLDKPVEGDIVGFVSDDIISIVVRWKIASVSMSTWVGQVVDAGGKERIRTLWHLIRNTPEADEPEDAWAAVIAGADTFTR
jgi:hypothetical protein